MHRSADGPTSPARASRIGAAVAVLAVTLAVAGCGAPGVLGEAATQTPEAVTSTAPATEAPQHQETPTVTATDPPEAADASGGSGSTPPPVLPMPVEAPPNPYYGDAAWAADAPIVRSALEGPTVDVYVACAEWWWSVRVGGTEHACDPGDPMTATDAQLPILAVTGVPIAPGEVPAVEQQQYAPWDPEEHWATVLVVDPGVVPTAAALGARIEPPARVGIECAREGLISFGPGMVACHYGGEIMDLGPLPDHGALAVPAPVEYVPLFPSAAHFYGAP